MGKIYAAYGSNMNLRQMAKRCPNAKVIGTGKAKAKGYRLTFRGMARGVANIERQRGYTVPIVLWDITEECEKALDVYEGYPNLYTKKDIRVTQVDGSEISAMVYVMTPKYEKYPSEPSTYYLDTIAQGYRDNKISVKTLRQAILENIREMDEVNIRKPTMNSFWK